MPEAITKPALPESSTSGSGEPQPAPRPTAAPSPTEATGAAANVEQLLNQVQAGADQVAEQLGATREQTPSGESSAPAQSSPAMSIDDAVQAALADAQRQSTGDAEPTAGFASTAPADVLTPEPVAPAEKQTAANTASSPGPEPASTEPAPPPPSLNELDSKLAASAAAAVESDFADPSEIAPPIAPAAAAPAAIAPATEVPTAPAAEPTTPTPVAPTTAPSIVAPAPEQPTLFVRVVERPLQPVAAKLATLPPVVTQSLGWAGVCTLFWAGIVWINALVFMGPSKPPTAEHEDAREVIGAPGPDGKPIQPKPHKPRHAAGESKPDGGHGAPASSGHAEKGTHAEAGKAKGGGEHSGGH